MMKIKISVTQAFVTLLVPVSPLLRGISLDARTKVFTTVSCALKERRRRDPNSLTRHPASKRVLALLYASSMLW